MTDARFTILTPALLETVVGMIDRVPMAARPDFSFRPECIFGPFSPLL